MFADFLNSLNTPRTCLESTTYVEQRKERLLDILSEYLDNPDVSLVTFLTDLETCVIKMKKHHEEALNKIIIFKDYLP